MFGGYPIADKAAPRVSNEHLRRGTLVNVASMSGNSLKNSPPYNLGYYPASYSVESRFGEKGGKRRVSVYRGGCYGR